MSNHPQDATSVASTTGAANMTFMMQLRTPADIADVEARLAVRVPGVEIIEACVGVHAFKRMGWMLNHDSTATGKVVVKNNPTTGQS